MTEIKKKPNKRDEKSVNMEAFLVKVNDHRELLFDKFTGSDGKITKRKKEEKWEEIPEECAKDGNPLVENKTWKDLWDRIFAKFKNATKEKLDKEGKTGTSPEKYNHVSFYFVKNFSFFMIKIVCYDNYFLG